MNGSPCHASGNSRTQHFRAAKHSDLLKSELPSQIILHCLLQRWGTLRWVGGDQLTPGHPSWPGATSNVELNHPDSKHTQGPPPVFFLICLTKGELWVTLRTLPRALLPTSLLSRDPSAHVLSPPAQASSSQGEGPGFCTPVTPCSKYLGLHSWAGISPTPHRSARGRQCTRVFPKRREYPWGPPWCYFYLENKFPWKILFLFLDLDLLRSQKY